MPTGQTSNRQANLLAEVSWATQLGLDMSTLEKERPDNWLQKQLTRLHTQRATAYAEYVRLRDTDQAFSREDIAWERYKNLTRTVCDLTGKPIPVGILDRESQRRQLIEEKVLHNTCTRCGYVRNSRQPAFVGGLCSSCLALQEKVLRRGRLACQPWQGRFAPDDVTPVNAAGEPILPGHRVCKNSDCVNPKHIRKGRNQNG